MVDTTIAAHINQLCPFSHTKMDGLEICRFTVQQYNYLFDILRNTQMPDELIELVLSFSIFNKSNIGNWGIKLYVNFIELSTKYGRKIFFFLRNLMKSWLILVNQKFSTPL